VPGISIRSVDARLAPSTDLGGRCRAPRVKALGMAGISKSQVSRLCAEIDERVRTFLERPTNPLERVNGEVKRRTEVVGILPNEAAITPLVGAILLEQNDEWAVQRVRYITLDTIAPLRDDFHLMLPWPHESKRPDPAPRFRPPNSYTT
jgi:Transposase, Mutator family